MKTPGPALGGISKSCGVVSRAVILLRERKATLFPRRDTARNHGWECTSAGT